MQTRRGRNGQTAHRRHIVPLEDSRERFLQRDLERDERTPAKRPEKVVVKGIERDLFRGGGILIAQVADEMTQLERDLAALSLLRRRTDRSQVNSRAAKRDSSDEDRTSCLTLLSSFSYVTLLK